MSTRHHYVSQFHLRASTDPTATKSQEPWLWVGDCVKRTIERRAPKNVAWSRDLFAGPGGLADREASIGEYLAARVESPAALLPGMQDEAAKRLDAAIGGRRKH